MNEEEAEARYRSIFESMSEGIGIVDENNILVEANPALARMFGLTLQEMIGLPIQMNEAGLHQSLEEHGFYHRRVVNRRKDGSLAYQDARISRITYRGEPHYLTVVRNLSDQAEAYHLLEQRAEARTRELATLLDVSRNVTSTLELRSVLELVLDALKEVIAYDGAAILSLRDEEIEYLVRRAPTQSGPGDRYRFRPEYMTRIIEVINRGEPLIIDDIRGDSPMAEAYRQHAPDLINTRFSYVRSWMAVPMTVRDQVISMLILASSEPGYYTPDHADLAMAFAQQAAIAMENARLYEQAQRAAALEERQRLARELHDSVSQALYGIGLAAQTARALIESDPAGAIRPLDFVVSLAQTGMAEMRALIFELRPESLENEGLVAALDKQAAASSARHSVPVVTALGAEPDLPLGAKETLYRIAQEALHNAFKHAAPVQVRLTLDRRDGEIVLEVRDDGRGFDTGGSFPGHLGLLSMAERAAGLSGRLEVDSTPGRGTVIRAVIPGVPSRV